MLSFTNEYYYIGIVLLIKICRPYLKKQIDINLDDNKFIIYNTITILTLAILYNVLNGYFSNQCFDLNETIQSYINFSPKTKLIMLVLGVFTLINTMSFFKLDKSNNQSKISLIIKSISSIFAIILGSYINNETLRKNEIAGIIILGLGLYLLGKSD